MAVQTVQELPIEDKKEGEGEKGKCGFKGTGRAFFGEEQAQDSEWKSEEDCAWWSKGNRGQRGFSKGNEGFQKGFSKGDGSFQ